MYNKSALDRLSNKNGPSDDILGRINKTKLDSNQTTINSAALQDHIMQSYNLGSFNSFGQRVKTYKKPNYLKKYPKKKPGMPGRALSNAGKNIMRTDSASSVPTSNVAMPQRVGSYSNSLFNSQEESKVGRKHNQVYQTKNLLEKLNSETYIDIEKKRESYVHKLSLAQRRGLVARPPMPLSQGEWKSIEQKGATRVEKNDF